MGVGIGQIVGVTLVLSVLLGALISRVHLWLPALFPEPAAFPYLAALITTMSFAATLLMAHKRTECWWYWIVVDVSGIGWYWARDVRLITLLYVVFLALAIHGLRSWRSGVPRTAVTVKEAAT